MDTAARLQARQVVHAVVGRAAKILGACLAAIVEKVRENQPRKTYAIVADGSVYTKYEKYRQRVHAALAAQIAHMGGRVEGVAAGPKQENFEVRFVACDGGSTFGAAVLAAVEHQHGKADS